MTLDILLRFLVFKKLNNRELLQWLLPSAPLILPQVLTIPTNPLRSCSPQMIVSQACLSFQKLTIWWPLPRIIRSDVGRSFKLGLVCQRQQCHMTNRFSARHGRMIVLLFSSSFMHQFHKGIHHVLVVCSRSDLLVLVCARGRLLLAMRTRGGSCYRSQTCGSSLILDASLSLLLQPSYLLCCNLPLTLG
jgi:hypothetical protein